MREMIVQDWWGNALSHLRPLVLGLHRVTPGLRETAVSDTQRALNTLSCSATMPVWGKVLPKCLADLLHSYAAQLFHFSCWPQFIKMLEHVRESLKPWLMILAPSTLPLLLSAVWQAGCDREGCCLNNLTINKPKDTVKCVLHIDVFHRLLLSYLERNVSHDEHYFPLHHCVAMIWYLYEQAMQILIKAFNSVIQLAVATVISSLLQTPSNLTALSDCISIFC